MSPCPRLPGPEAGPLGRELGSRLPCRWAAGSAVEDLQEGLAELNVEGGVDDGVHGAVDVAQPREGAVQDGWDVAVTVYVQDVGDEEGQPADDEHAWGRGGQSGVPGAGEGLGGEAAPGGAGGRTRIACFRPRPGTKAARAPQGEPRSWMPDLPLTPVCSHLTSLGLVFLPAQCI